MATAAFAPQSPSARNFARRYFHLGTAIIMLAMVLAAFSPWLLRGHGFGERLIDPGVKPYVAVHGTALTSWFVLYLLQSALIAGHRRSWHRTSGWITAGVASICCISGLTLAVVSVQASPPFQFWGMDYRQFLMIMLTEMLVFASFVILGVLNRKIPQRHRAMMLLAGLAILAGASVRLPRLIPLFGDAGWSGVFGPVMALGGLFVLARWWIDGRPDGWLITGYVAMGAIYGAAVMLATMEPWSGFVRASFPG